MGDDTFAIDNEGPKTLYVLSFTGSEVLAVNAALVEHRRKMARAFKTATTNKVARVMEVARIDSALTKIGPASDEAIERMMRGPVDPE